ncbi:MAG: VWA domain-containing protein, partial [Devosia sp.]|nr:VWA domain-containing protein [Devosia sp.]
GLAWGWYMIAPNFASLWPTASQPAAYGEANLIKAVILMTDGDFNTPYCTGVIASDALSGSGSSSTHINCPSPNGSSKAQAQALCDAIKAESNHTLLYTVGFDLGSNAAALTFLEGCATTPTHFFQADTGADLEDAFQAIAETLSSLRISK